MGYQAILDSFEEWLGGAWSSRHRVVAWGAGAELLVNISSPDPKARSTIEQDEFYGEPHSNKWMTYREQHHAEGKDDITAVNIVRPSPQCQVTNNTSQDIVVGRANGELKKICISPNAKDFKVKHFDTSRSPVRSLDVTSGRASLFASCLHDDRLALFPLDADRHLVQPIVQTSVVKPSTQSCRTWSTRFLSSDKVAVGVGPAYDIVKVFDITRHGLSAEPVRSFGNGKGSLTSAYPVRSLPSSSASDPNGAGQVIVSGGYDGVVRSVRSSHVSRNSANPDLQAS